MHNFNISYDEIIALYPLDKVREIHISGGSWDDAEEGKKIRRDTHDDAVPQEVFDLLEKTIDRCPNLKYVVMEQLGNGLISLESKTSFYNDFIEMQRIVNQHRLHTDHPGNSFHPLSPALPTGIAMDENLYQQQLELSSILETAISHQDALTRLSQSSLARSDWQIESWKPYMVETAVKIAQKWKKAGD